MTKINVRNYQIFLGENIINQFETLIAEINQGNIFIITDSNVARLHLDELKNALTTKVTTVIIKPGEQSKSFKTYQGIIDTLLKHDIKKNDLLIAFGGGVVGDITGFIAATLFRGMAYIQIPTTIISQVDSSIGGKTGLDLSYGKNLIGSFYEPKRVLIDLAFLKTLSKREYNNGLVEAIKAGLIYDKTLYEMLKKEKKLTSTSLKKAINVKKKIVTIDFYDKDIRHILNFGHTFGHAIEVKHHYKKYKHGEAVAYGMLMALELGIIYGHTNPMIYEELKMLLLNLKVIKEPLLAKEDYLEHIKYDKKVVKDEIKFVFVKDIGEAEIKKIALEDF